MGLHDQKNYDEWVLLPNRGEWALNYVIGNIKEALKEKGCYSPKLYSDVYNDFSHVHCEICWRVISNDISGEVETGGYYSNDTWVCNQCYPMFVQPENYMDAVAVLERTAKPA